MNSFQVGPMDQKNCRVGIGINKIRIQFPIGVLNRNKEIFMSNFKKYLREELRNALNEQGGGIGFPPQCLGLTGDDLVQCMEALGWYCDTPAPDGHCVWFPPGCANDPSQCIGYQPDGEGGWMRAYPIWWGLRQDPTPLQTHDPLSGLEYRNPGDLPDWVIYS